MNVGNTIYMNNMLLESGLMKSRGLSKGVRFGQVLWNLIVFK